MHIAVKIKGRAFISLPGSGNCWSKGSIRGLLCHNCNSAIGFLGDSAENVYKAFLYLGGKNNA